MSVYPHQQGAYRCYRVVRSIDGKAVQEYFPRTRVGKKAADRRDKELAALQRKAQMHFTGPATRWRPNYLDDVRKALRNYLEARKGKRAQRSVVYLFLRGAPYHFGEQIISRAVRMECVVEGRFLVLK